LVHIAYMITANRRHAIQEVKIRKACTELLTHFVAVLDCDNIDSHTFALGTRLCIVDSQTLLERTRDATGIAAGGESASRALAVQI